MANEEIRFAQLQVIGASGENVGIISRDEALRLARETNLDLVLLSEMGGQGYPVAKIMDHGKELYNRKKKQAESKKNQKVIQIKEIKIRPKIGEHDYLTKINQGIGFLEDGKKLKITLTFRGREMANKNERGKELFDKIHSTFAEQQLLERIVEEKDIQAGSAWSKMFSLKKA